MIYEPFENTNFIKPCEVFDSKRTDYAPMYRRKFTVDENIESAEVFVCGLGIGYYYINGEPVSDDLFTAPFSDYRKTLWYNRYDVTDKLKSGENILAVMCGNGWYNEAIYSVWKFHEATWRDFPKFILCLFVNGKPYLSSDESWRYTLKSPIIYNQLRSGEHFDSRLYDEKWTQYDFDDSLWSFAKSDDNAPDGKFRECLCEPIREDTVYDTVNIIKITDSKYVFDVGQNISGYIRLTVNQKSGDLLKIRYAEILNPDNSLNLNNMEDDFYKDMQIQTDEFICCGKSFVWSPRFVYHGFRYIEIDGIEDINNIKVQGVFVHQAVARRSKFECSNEMLNNLFNAGIMSTWSNMFYYPTDCPTREKLGWTNDAAASVEQFLTNFHSEKFYDKWLVDIYDCIRDDGAVPTVIPTYSYGFMWGSGPVCDVVLFELPYRMYIHTGDKSYMVKAIPYMKNYLKYLASRENDEGYMERCLGDWTAPTEENMVDAEFINAVFKVRFFRMLSLAITLSGEDASKYKTAEEEQIRFVKEKYINADGYCVQNRQTAAALLIYYEIYDDAAPLKEQLKKLIEDNGFHHDCGMVGLRHLYEVLNICGLQEYAYKIMTATGIPSYNKWFERGATTLWEDWSHEYSRNHHMYSDFMSWMIKTILGISVDKTREHTVEVNPYFFKELDWVKGMLNTDYGNVEVKYERHGNKISLDIASPADGVIFYNGAALKKGINTFEITE